VVEASGGDERTVFTHESYLLSAPLTATHLGMRRQTHQPTLTLFINGTAAAAALADSKQLSETFVAVDAGRYHGKAFKHFYSHPSPSKSELECTKGKWRRDTPRTHLVSPLVTVIRPRLGSREKRWIEAYDRVAGGRSFVL